MSKLDQHPTVVKIRSTAARPAAEPLDAATLRRLCLDCGADDVGFVELTRPALDAERKDMLRVLPQTASVISFVCRMNRDPVRSPERSVANVEFHHTGDDTNDVAHQIVRRLEDLGIRAVNPPMAFPMEADRWPNKMWVVSHKPIAVAAGMGHMGIHRNVIHPQFGNFILLGTILLGSEVSEYSRPIDYNPCLECKLCVAACPVGAIASDGVFNFSACYHHNYREFMGGFADFAEQIAESKNGQHLREKTSRSDSVSMWQSLAFGPNYKSGYCISVCPAGEDVIGPYLGDKQEFLQQVVRPLQKNTETVYVVPGSDAEGHVERRFPHKKRRRVRGTLIPNSIDGFLRGLSLTFQREQSKGLAAVYHFTFTGSETRRATVCISDQQLHVEEDHRGVADLKITADSKTWLGFLAREKNLAWALLTLRIRLRGSPLWLVKFGKCFPS